MCQRLWRAVASSHSDSLGQDLFQLRRRSSCYQRPYQRQRVVIEVRLQRTASRYVDLSLLHETTADP